MARPTLPLLVSLSTVLIVALLIGQVGCGGSSPTAPQQTPRSSNVVFANPEALATHQAAITALLEDTQRRADDLLPVGFVQITVFGDAARAVQGWGIGGFAPSASQVEIAIDPNFPGLAEILPERLPPIAAHELHHAARWQGPGYGMTLLESMVSEGLADHFAIELLGAPMPPWTEAFPEDQTDVYLDRARPLFDSTTFDFNAWFFGPSMDLPRWTGYTLGFRLVRDYKAANPGSSAVSLVNASAEVFRP